MPSEFLDAITVIFYQCEPIPDAGGVVAAARMIEQLGGRFVRLNGPETHPDPLGHQTARGDLLGGPDFEHERLLQDAQTVNDVRHGVLPTATAGRAGFWFVQETRSIRVDQRVWSAESSFTDRLARGLLDFALFLYPHLRPRYGSIDELGGNEPERTDIDGDRLRYLYWANFFSPEFVRSLGPDFFRRLPGWRVIDLDDGGILYVATESYTAWREGGHPELVTAFRRRFPRVEQYRAVMM